MIPGRQDEVVITLDSAELSSFPFLFMTGHKLVRFSERERQGLRRSTSRTAACSFRTTATTT